MATPKPHQGMKISWRMSRSHFCFQARQGLEAGQFYCSLSALECWELHGTVKAWVPCDLCFSGVFLHTGGLGTPLLLGLTSLAEKMPLSKHSLLLLQLLFFTQAGKALSFFWKLEPLLFAFNLPSFFFLGFGFRNSKARRGSPFSAFG